MINDATFLIQSDPTTTKADLLLAHIGAFDISNHEFRHRILRRFPEKLKMFLAKNYLSIYESTIESRKNENAALFAANSYFLEIEDLTKEIKIPLFADDDQINAIARNNAASFKRIFRFNNDLTFERAYETLQKQGMSPPKIEKNITKQGTIKRMCCPNWWRRQLRRIVARRSEDIAVKLGAVNNRKSKYISDESMENCESRRLHNHSLLEHMLATNELGEEFELLEIHDKSISNPTIKRAELMTRIDGFEKVADTMCHTALFITFTAPSAMHPILSTTGMLNPKYEGNDHRETHDWLVHRWKLIRSCVKRNGIDVYGFRVVEPHHDGTPHWHLLLFIQPKHKQKFMEICRLYMLEEYGDEQGAEQRRVQFVTIDKRKGRATGYIAKYIAKNIDGFGLATDIDFNVSIEKSNRVKNWANTHGIRQFQQIGGPPVTVWRELRRLSSATGIIEQARILADSANWEGFVSLMGGPTVSRQFLPINIARYWNDRPGEYGDPLGYKIFGLQSEDSEVCTRPHIWTISVNPSLLAFAA